MPYIQVTHTRDALEGVDRDALTDELARVGSDAEGSEYERARPLTWVTYDAPDDFRSDADPAVAVRATVAEGLVDDAGRETLVEGVTEALTGAVEGLEPMATWVVIEEVPDGNWGAGGGIVPSSQIAALTGGETVDD